MLFILKVIMYTCDQKQGIKIMEMREKIVNRYDELMALQRRLEEQIDNASVLKNTSSVIEQLKKQLAACNKELMDDFSHRFV
jgi:dephospho-CoA kinase